MKKKDFTVTILVDKTPQEAFDAINNVRGWWSGEIEGATEKLGDEFSYRFKEFHYSKQRLVEVVPAKRVVWLITESSINFVADKKEWVGTKIIFEISPVGSQTEVRFTHQGLVPDVECYDACSNAWTGYVSDSLRNFISASSSKPQDFTRSFLVGNTPDEVFTAVNNVRGWWSENISGDTAKLGSEFKYHYQDIHLCKIKIIESVPGQKVVWLVLDNYFQFTKDKSEWRNTKIIFDITAKGRQTELRFTHQGLVPDYECYEVCNDAWTHFVCESLRGLITTGKGDATHKDVDEINSQVLEKWQLQ